MDVVLEAPLPTQAPKPVVDRICKRLLQGARIALSRRNDYTLIEGHDDIEVEVSLKLWSQIHTFKGKSLISWSKVSAGNLYSKWIKTKKHQRLASQAVSDGDEDAIAQIKCACAGPVDEAIHNEFKQRLWEAIDDLDPTQRLVARIWFYEAKTIKEIALKTGLNTNDVLSEQRRIRKVFLAKWGEDPLAW